MDDNPNNVSKPALQGVMPPKVDQNSEYQGDTLKRPLRSITRLIIGTIALGMDDLLQNIQKWEETYAESTNQEQEAIPADLEPEEMPTMPLDNERLIADTSAQLPLPPTVETDDKKAKVQYAAIGLVFETQERISSGFNILNRASLAVGKLASPYVQTLSNNRLVVPLQANFDHLVDRGQQEVNRWVDVGRREDAHSRALAQTAMDDSIDRSVDFLTANEDVQELVQSQSISLAEEVVEEVRERTVSADNYLEGVLRSFLRRPSRLELPPPPPEVRSQAQNPSTFIHKRYRAQNK